MEPAISVVIPCYNESDSIGLTISRIMNTFRLDTAPRIYVIDAGKFTDGTEKIVADLALRYQHSIIYTHLDKPSRGKQLMTGASMAKTPFLLFLHADTLLPIGWDASIVEFFESSDNALPLLGCFQLALPPPFTLSLRIMVWTANLRASLFQLPYGDQAYFVRRQDFEAVGGFADIPLMEDVDLLRRYKQEHARRTGLKKSKRHIIDYISLSNFSNLLNTTRCVQVMPLSVITSPRRWNRKGVWWNTLCNQFYMLAWMIGVSPTTIYQWYYGKKGASR